MEEKTLGSRYIYKGKILNLRMDEVEMPNNITAKREIIEHSESVGIVAVDNDYILMVNQYRSPLKRSILEIPAGNIDPGENPEEAALREMSEETGFLPQRLDKLGSFYLCPGYSNEKMHCFLATDLIPHKKEGDIDENIEVIRVKADDLVRMVESCEIEDVKTVAGILLYNSRRS